MGVFGQIYGSRIVVGLASPSQNQLGAIGKGLVAFNRRVYGSFSKNRIEAAKKSRDIAQKELDTSRQQLKSFQESTSGLILDGVKSSIKQLRGMSGSKGPAMEAGGAITRLSKQMKDAGFKMQPALMKGVKPWMKNAQKMEKMLRNLSGMDRKEQARVLDFVKKRRDQQQRLVDELKDEYETGKITKAQYKKQKKLLEEYKLEYIEFNEAVTTNGKVLDDINTKETKLKNNVKEKQKIQNKAERQYQQALKETKEAIVKITKKTTELILALKQGFTQAVQQSVIALTAFYYKLNESTQELVAFERELLNANSVFNITRTQLFDTGEAITQFGQKFGMEMQNGATGLYQLASAGLSAADALTVLPETLKLSMAVQGDHNTISKLTAQTIMGFGMEFSDSAILVDKFAHSIQKSLIEYQDLSSAVKFALPFFTATGQSIDQLLGALEILTNRALEAGIAGRGLRQALSEFAEHADDNAAAFRRMGVEILNTDGTMRQLTEIAADYASKIGPEAAHNTELLTSMIQDLNVRGATAFIHLVQSSDEFTQSVEDLENAGGELDEMVKIQNQSLQAQIQILKNNVQAIFLMRDAEYEGTEYMNAFHEAVSKLVAEFQALLVVEKEGTYVLTEFGAQLQEVAIEGVYMFIDLGQQLVQIIKDFTTEGRLNLDILRLYAVPLKIIMDAFNAMGPNMQRAVIYLHMMNKLIPIQTISMTAFWLVQAGVTREKIKENAVDLIGLPRKLLGIAYRWLMVAALNAEIAAGNGNNVVKVQENALDTYSFATKLKSLALYPLRISKMMIMTALTWIYTTALGMEAVAQGVVNAAKEKEMFIEQASLGTKIKAIALFPIRLAYMGLMAMWQWSLNLSFISGTAAAAVFWIVATGGLILAIGLIGLLFIKLFEAKGEMGFIEFTIHLIKSAITSLGAKVREVWEERIYPFIYLMGMEFRAFFGIMGMWLGNIISAIQEWIDKSETVKWALSGLGTVLKTALLLPLNLVLKTVQSLIAGFELLMDVIHHVSKGQWGRAGAAGVEFLAKMVEIWGSNWSSLSFADGGYIKAMAGGGSTAPMNIVGEEGPEIFMPSQSGQIINSRRTQEILYDIKRRAGADSTGRGMANTIIVNEIRAQKSVNRKTRMSVDTFAGVV